MTQKVPKLVGGPLASKSIVFISAGYRHSAAVTSDGLLYTWGEGEYGRLGTGDGQSRYLPALVKDLSNVGSVSCGGSHTLALSKDKKTVWSFGSGEGGRLGHGDTSRQYRPKVIEELQGRGLTFEKVVAGFSSNLALTTDGQVWTWGSGKCLGVAGGASSSDSSSSETFLLPTHLDGFGADRYALCLHYVCHHTLCQHFQLTNSISN